MSKLVVTNIETQNIKFDSDTTAFTIASDGATAFSGSVTGAGAMTLLKTVTPSTVASVDFVHGSSGVVLDGTYKRYIITFDNLVPTAAGPYLFTFLSTNSGSSYGGNNAYNGVNFKYGSNGSTNVTQAQPSPNGFFHDGQIDNDATANGGVSGSIEISGIGTTHRQTVKMIAYHYDHNSYYQNSDNVGSLTNTTAVNGVRVAFNSGNIASGTVKLYAIK
jgi:hypothetical protein